MQAFRKAVLFVAVLSICTIANGQAFQMDMATVAYDSANPAAKQPFGPAYAFDMGRYEVTVAQYITFLNDAEANQGNERGANLAFRANGDVGLPDDNMDNAYVFSLAANNTNGYFDYGLTYNAGSSVGSRYGYNPSYARHPIMGVSWFGAVKFCNWLTIDQGMPPAERAYHEGPGQGGYYPNVGTLPLDDAKRWELVVSYRGFRLPMDENGSGSAGAFNEWYKAAAWDGDATANRVYGFGRDTLTAADANSLASGDPWEPGTTPVGYYDGVNPGTNANGNYYGICDLSGNAMEWMQDWDIGGRRTERGGSYNDTDPALQLRVDHPRNQWPRSPSAGFRVVFVPRNPGDANIDGKVNVFDLAILASSYGDSGKLWTDADFTGDGNVNVFDLAILANNYGYGTGGTAGQSVPEPATLAMLVLGGVAVVRRKARGRMKR